MNYRTNDEPAYLFYIEIQLILSVDGGPGITKKPYASHSDWLEGSKVDGQEDRNPFLY